MDSGERQLHLRLRAGDLRHTKSRGAASGVAEQRSLADARLASDDQDGALIFARVCEEAVERFALAGPVEERGRESGGHLVGKATAPRRSARSATIRQA